MESPSLMTQFFMWMGPYKWPMMFLSALVLFLIVKKAVEIISPAITQKQKESGINAILFWGAISMASGLFVQALSIWKALQDIQFAGDISPALVIIGFYGSFTSVVLGTGTLIVAALSWWLFRYRVRLAVPGT